jgi:hypothetical protein
MAKSPIIGGFSRQRSSQAADNDTVNMSIEVLETKDGKVNGFMFIQSGLDLMGEVGLFVLTGGTIFTAGTGYAVGEITTLAPGDGVQVTSAQLRVVSVNGSGAVTAFTVSDPGTFSTRPTSFTQQVSSGAGTGISISAPVFDTQGPIRGVLDLDDILYVVSGPQVWSVTPNGVLTLLSTQDNQLSDAATPVSMFANNRQLMIVDGVGAWLVPGGYPLLNGAITSGGGLYAVRDTITLKGATGDQFSYPIIEVTAVTNNAVATFRTTNLGTGYADAAGVATTNYQPKPATGSGFTIDIIATGTGGAITAATVNASGSGYLVGQTGTISTGSGTAIFQILTVSSGAVTSFQILDGGTGYSVRTDVAAVNGNGITPCGGVGFIVDILTSAGAVIQAGLNNGGRGYSIGNAGFYNGGGANATYFVDTVGPTGDVTAFRLIQGGAINDKAATFTQQSTSGSGDGFSLADPAYDDFLNLVPVTMPFPNPVSGGVSDGFGLLVFIGRQEIAQSDEQDLSTWDPLIFGLANQSPDNCIGLKVVHNQVYVGKQKNTEVWVDQGSANFAFGPVTSVHMEYGWMSPYAASRIGEELAFLSRNDEGQGIVMLASGYRLEEISTQALVNEFLEYENLGDAISYGRQEGQHLYYVLTFPQANKTWCYDRTASRLAGVPIWTRLAAFENGEFNRHWGNCYTPWDGTVRITETTDSYQPFSVLMIEPTELDTSVRLANLANPFANAVFSMWVYLPDVDIAGFWFSNQDDDTLVTTNPGLQIGIQNDSAGTPQITVKAWDVSTAIIVSAAYSFTTWEQWVNLMISIGTAGNQLQVYANANLSGTFTEEHLTADTITWSSTNAIGNPSGKTWHVKIME